MKLRKCWFQTLNEGNNIQWNYLFPSTVYRGINNPPVYSWPSLVWQYTEGPFSRPFVGENQFRLVLQSHISTENAVGCFFPTRRNFICLYYNFCINCKIYCPYCKVYHFFAKYIRLNCKMYLFELQNVFVYITKCIFDTSIAMQGRVSYHVTESPHGRCLIPLAVRYAAAEDLKYVKLARKLPKKISGTKWCRIIYICQTFHHHQSNFQHQGI